MSIKKIIFYGIVFAIISFLIGTTMIDKFKKNKSYGTVIILNGPSAAGKSSIQKEFQSLMMPNLWIKLGIDNLFDNPMPDINLENIQFWQSKNPIRWVETTTDKDQNSVIILFVGDQGEKVAYSMNSAIAEYAKNGCNCIVDYIAYKKEWIDDLHDKLKDVKTYWVKVNIPLLVLEERETARGTSPKGHSRSHYEIVFWDLNYDFEVNTDKESAREIARKIKDFLQ
jgi:chloramphenicol 3-O phosphotransferase